MDGHQEPCAPQATLVPGQPPVLTAHAIYCEKKGDRPAICAHRAKWNREQDVYLVPYVQRVCAKQIEALRPAVQRADPKVRAHA